MLDKELQPIVRQAKRGRRYVDKLVKVWLKSGQEQLDLIHIEVQAGRRASSPSGCTSTTTGSSTATIRR